VRLSEQAARAGDLDDIGEWMKESGRSEFGIDILECNSRRDHNGMGSCCGEGQEAECRLHVDVLLAGWPPGGAGLSERVGVVEGEVDSYAGRRCYR